MAPRQMLFEATYIQYSIGIGGGGLVDSLWDKTLKQANVTMTKLKFEENHGKGHG